MFAIKKYLIELLQLHRNKATVPQGELIPLFFKNLSKSRLKL